MNPEEEKQRAIWRKEKHLELKAELQQNEKFMKFLEKGYPTSREDFLDEYARAKVSWMEWGPKEKVWLEKDDLKWVEDATDRLAEILQKKLFDVQCQWRAEKIQIPQIKLTFDFNYWEDNIFNCPFIETVNEKDVEIYLQYLNSFNFENEQGWFSRWQDYREIKEAYNDNSDMRNFPEWYDFHNGRTGLSVYLLLPDTRGEKEEFYLHLWREDAHKKSEEQKKKMEEEKKQQAADLNLPLTPQTDRRPRLDYHKKGWMTWFVNTFEDKQTQEIFKRFGGERAFDEYDDYVEEDLDILGKAGKPIPVEAWFDWKEAIHKAADKYRREKIIEALPQAFEQYRMKVDMGFTFEEPNPIFTLKDWYHNAILRGRELNGDPPDFNF